VGIHANTRIWGCAGGPCSEGGGEASGGSTPTDSGGIGAGSTNPESTSAGSAGPGGGGAGGGGAWTEAPVPGSTLPNGDVAVGMDLWHRSAKCPNCGVIWAQSQAGVYWFMEQEAESIATGGVIAEAGAFLSTLPKMRVAVSLSGGSPGVHFAYEAGGKFLNGVSFEENGVTVVVRGAKGTFAKAFYQASIPIRSESAVIATEGRRGWNCFTAAVYAVFKGWTP